eukprot:Sspe_Gene.5231::Locus_1724_Transcript_1_1_Confidence_1.000_Length_1516::g.5231::m.5231
MSLEALQQASNEALLLDHEKGLKECQRKKPIPAPRIVAHIALREVLCKIFEFLPCAEVFGLACVCRAWCEYLGRYGINYVTFLLNTMTHPECTSKVGGNAPFRFTTESLQTATIGVRWQEDGKELGAVVQIRDRETVRAAQGSDASAWSSSLAKYCGQDGRVEDVDSDDLEVVFPDGVRKWIAAKAVEGSRRERWIVRVPPGPFWAELWLIGGSLVLQTLLEEVEPPGAMNKPPWVLKPVWPARSRCVQVALIDDGLLVRHEGEGVWQKLERGMVDYTVVKGVTLLPDVILCGAGATRAKPGESRARQFDKVDKSNVL